MNGTAVEEWSKDMCHMETCLGAGKKTAENSSPKKKCPCNRRTKKPQIEKRRRDRMNRCLESIKQLILTAKQQPETGTRKMEKADILEMAQQFLQSLLGQPGFQAFMQGASCKLQHSPITSTLPDSPSVCSSLSDPMPPSASHHHCSSTSSTSFTNMSFTSPSSTPPPSLSSSSSSSISFQSSKNTVFNSDVFQEPLVTMATSQVSSVPIIVSPTGPHGSDITDISTNIFKESSTLKFSNFPFSSFASTNTEMPENLKSFQSDSKNLKLSTETASNSKAHIRAFKSEPEHSFFEKTNTLQHQTTKHFSPSSHKQQRVFTDYPTFQAPSTTFFRPWDEGASQM